MERSVILYIATSLDGYIATDDESLEWLFRVEGEGDNGSGIWIVGGGDLIGPLVRENAVDEYIINIAPTIIGSGIPLFRRQSGEVGLELKSVRRFGHFAELHYVKNRHEQPAREKQA